MSPQQPGLIASKVMRSSVLGINLYSLVKIIVNAIKAGGVCSEIIIERFII